MVTRTCISVTIGLKPQLLLLGAKPQLLGAKPQLLGARPQLLGAKPQLLGAKPQLLGARPQLLGAKPQLQLNNQSINFWFVYDQVFLSFMDLLPLICYILNH